MPWRIETLFCVICTHDFVICLPHGTKMLECPGCRFMTPVRRAPTA